MRRRSMVFRNSWRSRGLSSPRSNDTRRARSQVSAQARACSPRHSDRHGRHISTYRWFWETWTRRRHTTRLSRYGLRFKARLGRAHLCAHSTCVSITDVTVSYPCVVSPGCRSLSPRHTFLRCCSEILSLERPSTRRIVARPTPVSNDSPGIADGDDDDLDQASRLRMTVLQPISQQSYNSVVIRASLRPSTTLGLCRSLCTNYNQAGSFASFNAAEFNPQRVNSRLRSSMLLAKSEICEQSPFMAASRVLTIGLTQVR